MLYGGAGHAANELAVLFLGSGLKRRRSVILAARQPSGRYLPRFGTSAVAQHGRTSHRRPSARRLGFVPGYGPALRARSVVTRPATGSARALLAPARPASRRLPRRRSVAATGPAGRGVGERSSAARW